MRYPRTRMYLILVYKHMDLVLKMYLALQKSFKKLFETAKNIIKKNKLC